jgi:hypothetical protein
VCRICNNSLPISKHQDKVARLLVDIVDRMSGLPWSEAMKLKSHVCWKLAELFPSTDEEKEFRRSDDDECCPLSRACSFCSLCDLEVSHSKFIDSCTFATSLLPTLLFATDAVLDDLLVDIISYIRELQRRRVVEDTKTLNN